MDNGENDALIPGVGASHLETACLKLAELPEAFAIVQAASDSNRHSEKSSGINTSSCGEGSMKLRPE